MQIYFVKATYTNNIYKISDFFVFDIYNAQAGKMLNINFKPDDGLTTFITKQLTLPDATYIRDHTHILVPSLDKIYRIASIDYLNYDQIMVTLDEDALIGNYQELKDEDIIMTRSNDPAQWRGVNDIADLTIEETVTTKMISSGWKTGKWALLFFQFNPADNYIGLKFDNGVYGDFYESATLTTLRAEFPEVSTTQPELYEYFQMTAYVVDNATTYQCVFNVAGAGSLKWVEYNFTTSATHYFRVDQVQASKINKTDIMTVCIALPFETDLYANDVNNRNLLSYDKFIGPVDTSLIDVKIVNDLLFQQDSISNTLVGEVMRKTPVFNDGFTLTMPTYSDSDGTDTLTTFNIISMFGFETDIDISGNYDLNPQIHPKTSEPFYRYELYVYGKKVVVPYYFTNDIHLLIAMNSGVVNWIVYYKVKRNIIASGSFTHSIKYQIDQLDAFYSQNPTYKDQFFTKMAMDSVKTIVGGAVGGAVLGPVGVAGGLALGLAGAGVDAGISMINLGFQEKGLKMKPDQMFGENSEVSLQVINIFGIYWVKKESENKTYMDIEYDLRGFPTAYKVSIDELTSASSFFGTTKVVYGEIKTIIKNNYVTGFINQKLKEGIIIDD